MERVPRRRAPGHALEAQVALRPETERFGHAEGLLEWDAEFPPSAAPASFAPSRVDARRLGRADRGWSFFDFGAIRTVPRAGGVLEFAFCYPYSYESVCATVDALARANLGDDVYLRRETLTTSLEGRPVELLTITANDDTYFGDEPLDWHAPQNSTDKSTRGGLRSAFQWKAATTRSDDGEDSGPEGTNKPSLSKPPLLTPHRKDTEVRRCAKREVIISVHPGETPAQFVVDGLLAAVLADGPVGQALGRPTCGGSCLASTRTGSRGGTTVWDPCPFDAIAATLYAAVTPSPRRHATRRHRTQARTRGATTRTASTGRRPHRSRASTRRKRPCKL